MKIKHILRIRILCMILALGFVFGFETADAAGQISFVGNCTGTTSCTPPAHQVGDLFIVIVGRDATTTAPTLASGWTSVTTASINGTSTADSVILVACKVATTTSETVTGFTSGANLVALIYRGTKAPTTSCAADTLGTPSNFTSTVNTTTTTATFNSVTNSRSDSWDVGLIYTPAATAGTGTAPTGMSNRATAGSTKAAGHDTNGGVSSFTSANVTVTTAGRILTSVIEIKKAVAYTFSPIATVNEQADLTAQFDIALSGIGPAITASVPVTGFVGPSGNSFSFSPTASGTTAASAQLATTWSTAASITSALTSGIQTSQTISQSLTTSAATNNAIGQTLPTSITAGITVKNATTESASMSVGTAAGSQFATQWSLPVSITNGITVQNAITESATIAFTTASVSQFGTQWTLPVALTTANIVNQGTAWTISTPITVGMSVTQFALNAGGGNAFNFTPALTVTSGLLANLATANNQSTASVNTNVIVAFQQSRTLLAVMSDTVSSSTQFGTSWNTIASITTSFASGFGTNKQALASLSTSMLEQSGIATIIGQSTSVGMSVQFSVHRGGQRRRRIIVL